MQILRLIFTIAIVNHIFISFAFLHSFGQTASACGVGGVGWTSLARAMREKCRKREGREHYAVKGLASNCYSQSVLFVAWFALTLPTLTLPTHTAMSMNVSGPCQRSMKTMRIVATMSMRVSRTCQFSMEISNTCQRSYSYSPSPPWGLTSCTVPRWHIKATLSLSSD